MFLRLANTVLTTPLGAPSGPEALYDAERWLPGERDGRIGSRHGSCQGQEFGVEADRLGGGALGKPPRPRLPCRPLACGSALGSYLGRSVVSLLGLHVLVSVTVGHSLTLGDSLSPARDIQQTLQRPPHWRSGQQRVRA